MWSLLSVLAATAGDGMLPVYPGAEVEQPAALRTEREAIRTTLDRDGNATAASRTGQVIGRILGSGHAACEADGRGMEAALRCAQPFSDRR